jgi:hypothetical protein
VEGLREKVLKAPASQAVLKRIQQLEDQVRARDLVIELLYFLFFDCADE